MSTTAESVLLDREERQRARLSLDANVVVEAGAGTGKTSLLADRALFLMLGRGVPVTKIVALTFTEKAAGEIQARLADRLADLIEALAGSGGGARSSEDFLSELEGRFGVSREAAAKRARAALEDLDKAVIGTLHRFAAALLRTYPLQAGVDPFFRIDDGGDNFEELFSSEWDRWLDSELAEGSPRERQWLDILRSTRLQDLEDLARGLCSPKVDLDRVDKRPPGLVPWLEEAVAALGSECARQPPVRGNIVPRLKEARERLEALLKWAPGADIPSPRGDMPSASWPASWDKTRQALCEEAASLAARVSPEGEARIHLALELLKPFVHRFMRAYSWRGFISFDGLLIRARDLVRDHPEVREELKSEFRAFLVDEFQDTDPLQGELLFYLSERRGDAAGRWEDIVLEPGKLFVVGDPKQSIYRFRGADLAAYERFVRHMLDREPKAVLCGLSANFRSGEGLLGPVNKAFSILMKYVRDSQPAYRAIHPALDAPSGVELVVVESPEASVKEQREIEAGWIASWIEDHCDLSGSPSPPPGKHRLKDVAILLRTTTPLEGYLEVLKAREIPYVVETEKYFYGTQEVQDFLNLLRALDDPSDRRAMAGLLRSPLAGLTDAELLAVASSGGLDYRREPAKLGLPASSAGRLKEFLGVLRSLHAEVGRRPLGGLIGDLMERTRLLELLPAAYHGQQTLSNLMKFWRMAESRADAEGRTLREFTRQVSRRISGSIEEGESPLADEQFPAVRLLTIHKSKGLEFPVVLVPNLSGSVQGRDDELVRLDWTSGALGVKLPAAAGLANAYLEMKERRKEDHEVLRLLYVAMTRAKDKLILIGSKEGNSASLSSLLRRGGLWPATADPGVEVHAVAVGPRRRAPVSRKALWFQGGGTPLDAEKLAPLWKAREARWKELSGSAPFISPSAAGKGLALRASSPAAPGAYGATGAAGEGSALWIGRVCHKVLEAWDYRSPGDLEGAVSKACSLLARENPRGAWDGVRRESLGVLSRFLKSPAARDLAAAEILGREIPFVHGEKGRLVRGSMDLLYREEGKLFVADYKTDKVAAAGADKAARLYEPQGMFYKTAVERALGAKGVRFRVIFLRLGRMVEVVP